MVENEYRRIGPPGTGKTHNIRGNVERAVAAWMERNPGKGPGDCKDVMICSLTKAAAAEVLSRVPLGRDCVATLHAHAWRGLDRPPIFGDKDIDDWNSRCQPQHRMAKSGKARSEDEVQDSVAASASGNDLLELYGVFRARLTDRSLWPTHLQAFADEYESYKRAAGRTDFSDVIDDAYRHMETAPGSPSVIFVDEAQDSSAAELRLIRRWGERADRFILVGDPDQNLYEWRGSDPAAFYATEIPPDNQRVLAQSYRVPRAVHEAAMRIIRRVSGRHDVDYYPRDADGVVRRSNYSLSGYSASMVASEVERDLTDGKSVMVLASCEYLLKGITSEFKRRAMPYWNPYARDRGEFNPLHPTNGVGAAKRVLDYLRPDASVYGDEWRLWTGSELKHWIEVMQASGWLLHGAKTQIEEFGKKHPHSVIGVQKFHGWLAPEAPGNIGTMDGLPWFRARLLKNREKPIDFAIRVLQKRGAAALRESPRLIVGTVHSVKGGEADVVYVSPELSTGGWETYSNARLRGATLRMMYVAATRAREKLVLLGQATKWSRCFDW